MARLDRLRTARSIQEALSDGTDPKIGVFCQRPAFRTAWDAESGEFTTQQSPYDLVLLIRSRKDGEPKWYVKVEGRRGDFNAGWE